MSRRTKVVGARAPILWLFIVVAFLLAAGLAVGGLVIYPQLQERRETQVRLDEAEQHYQAGVAFQNVGDWAAAEEEFKQVIALDANYKDAQTQLAEVRSKLAESAATVTAVAMAQAERAQADAQATAAAAPTVTAEALEAHYQKGLGYMNIGRWEEARAELEQVFEKDPNYKEVQAKLAEIKAIIPTSTPPPTATYTPSPTPTPCTQFEEARIEKAVASSVWDQEYMPDKAVDGDLDSGWWAASDKREGEWIELRLASACQVAKLEILNGYLPNWSPNPRAKSLILIFSDGSRQTISLYDNVKALQEVDLEPTWTSSIRFVVNSVYPGSQYQGPVSTRSRSTVVSNGARETWLRNKRGNHVTDADSGCPWPGSHLEQPRGDHCLLQRT